MSDVVQEHNFEMMQGEDRDYPVFQLLDNNENPVPLTGGTWTAKLQIREKFGGNVVCTLTSTPAAGLTINLATGEIACSWTSAQTAEFSFDKAVYDICVTSPASKKKYWVRGTITLLPRVTQ